MDIQILDPSPLLLELQDRLPLSFKLEFSDSMNWPFEGLLEVIELGLRNMVDALNVGGWGDAFNAVVAVHRLLLHPEVTHIDSVLSQCQRGCDLAELMARGLLITVLQLTRNQNLVGAANTEVLARFALEVKEIAICLSSALAPQQLWVLDETLQLLPFASMDNSTTLHFHHSNEFYEDFHTEFEQAYLDYIHTYLGGSATNFGKSTCYKISLWSEEKLRYIAAALSVLPVSPLSGDHGSDKEIPPWQTIKEFALLGKTKSRDWLRAQRKDAKQQQQNLTTPALSNGSPPVMVTRGTGTSSSSTTTMSSTSSLEGYVQNKEQGVVGVQSIDGYSEKAAVILDFS